MTILSFSSLIYGLLGTFLYPDANIIHIFSLEINLTVWLSEKWKEETDSSLLLFYYFVLQLRKESRHNNKQVQEKWAPKRQRSRSHEGSWSWRVCIRPETRPDHERHEAKWADNEFLPLALWLLQPSLVVNTWIRSVSQSETTFKQRKLHARIESIETSHGITRRETKREQAARGLLLGLGKNAGCDDDEEEKTSQWELK